MNQIFLVALLLATTIASAQQPNLEEQKKLFEGITDTTFEVPEERTAPGFEDGCWSQHSLWKRVGLLQKRGQGEWQDNGAGLLKFVNFYERSGERRCQGAPTRFAVFEQTFHQDGPYQNMWRLEGEPAVGNTFTFHSSFEFRANPNPNFYKEQCRFFRRTRAEKYLVCRVINQDAEGNLGFIGLLTYENVPNSQD